MTVYFVGSPAGCVKIGYTDAPEPSARVAALQTGNPHRLTCLAFCAGSSGDEGGLHSLLARHRLEGEWFMAHEEVLRVVDVSGGAIVGTFKGEDRTAQALARASSPDDVAAVWLRAATQDCAQFADGLDLKNSVPRVRELSELLAQKTSLEYHRRCTIVLPVRVEIPSRAVCTVDEFVRLVAHARCATYVRFQIRCVEPSWRNRERALSSREEFAQ